ncbi:MAG: hypothetical protein ABIL01_04560 [Pseudomonadota bacterium]
MLARVVVVVSVLAALTGAAQAQSGPGGARFCNQYASSAADIAGDAIKRNPSCLDFGKGMHANYQMHYNWCMRTPRFEAEGAGDNIRRLADRCSRGQGPGARRPAAGRQSPLQGAGILGREWQETEAGWRGTWTRLGNSNEFSAVWTHPSGGVVRASLTMTIVGNDIAIVRRDTFGSQVGKGCGYSGKIRGNQVGGMYQCDWDRGNHPWSARIN